MRCFSPMNWIGMLAVLGLGIMVSPAKAAYTLELGNADIQSVTGNGINQLQSPYATLTIIGDTTTGLLTFTLSTSAHNTAPGINAVFNDISFNTALTLNTDFSLVSASKGGSIDDGKNISEFGTFKYTVGGKGDGDRDEPYVFVLQLADHSKAVASNFAVANGDGKFFAAHIYTDLGGKGATGFIGDGDGGDGGNLQIPTPAPAGLILLASGLPVLGLSRLLRRRAVAA